MILPWANLGTLADWLHSLPEKSFRPIQLEINGELVSYMQGEELTIDQIPLDPLDDDALFLRIFDIAIQMCMGLEFIHSSNLVLCDLKPDNVFIMRSRGNYLRVKLGDFNGCYGTPELPLFLAPESTVYGTPQTHFTALLTRKYAAREIFLGGNPTKKADVWSMGIIIDEMSSCFGTKKAEAEEQQVRELCCKVRELCCKDRVNVEVLRAELMDIFSSYYTFDQNSQQQAYWGKKNEERQDLDTRFYFKRAVHNYRKPMTIETEWQKYEKCDVDFELVCSHTEGNWHNPHANPLVGSMMHFIIKYIRSHPDNTVKIRDATSGACVSTLIGHSDPVTSVCFSPDGSKIVTGSMDKTVKIWDATNGACVSTLEGHSKTVSSVCFSSDGSKIASFSMDNTVNIWDATNLSCVSTLKGHSNRVTSVCFSPDGSQIVSGSAIENRIWSEDYDTAQYLDSYNSVSDYEPNFFDDEEDSATSISNDDDDDDDDDEDASDRHRLEAAQ